MELGGLPPNQVPQLCRSVSDDSSDGGRRVETAKQQSALLRLTACHSVRVRLASGRVSGCFGSSSSVQHLQALKSQRVMISRSVRQAAQQMVKTIHQYSTLLLVLKNCCHVPTNFVLFEKVITLELGWVDFWQGMLVCNLLQEPPTARYIPSPLPEPLPERLKPERDSNRPKGELT
ncbi:unnamed protein product [Urochloa humidicola]